MTLTVVVWVAPERIDFMNYEQMWNDLKYYMELAVEEGTCCGYDKGDESFENGAFHAYNSTLRKMNRMEGKQNGQS